MSSGPDQRVGVFGGTFDPPHIGHVATAVEVQHSLGLDTLLFVVAGDPWQKSDVREISPASIRLEMVRAAVAALPRIEASAVEVDREGPSYMAETLEELAEQTDGELFLVVGSDAAAGLDTWHQPKEVERRAMTVVVDRGGREGGRPPEGWRHQVIDVPAVEVSSSELRLRVAEGRPVHGLVHSDVAALIDYHGLYREPR